jgi:hypothetical protein
MPVCFGVFRGLPSPNARLLTINRFLRKKQTKEPAIKRDPSPRAWFTGRIASRRQERADARRGPIVARRRDPVGHDDAICK